jgi:hypothetical protein
VRRRNSIINFLGDGALLEILLASITMLGFGFFVYGALTGGRYGMILGMLGGFVFVFEKIT